MLIRTFAKASNNPGQSSQAAPLSRLARWSRLAILSLGISSLLFACSTPQEEARKRQKLMTDFVAGVTQHLLDRNPATLKESMGVLTRNELTEPTVEKLQKLKLIPETDIGVLKLVDEAQRKHTSNEIIVAVVRPLTPPEKDSVTYKVTGREVIKTAGKPDDHSTFTYVMTCDLTPEMAGYPRITDIQTTSDGEPAQKPEEAKGTTKKKKRH